MSNLIQATVFAIGGSPIKGDPLSVYFPTHLISARDYTTSQLTDVNSQIDYYPNPNSQSQITPIWVGESVATLATEASTDMFPATVLAINTHGQNTPLNMLFPSVGTSVGPSSGTSVYSYIEFKGNTYYASEQPATLAASANTSGGGGPTIYTGDGSLPEDRTIGLNGHDLNIGFNIFSSKPSGISRVGVIEPNTLNVAMTYYASGIVDVVSNIEASFNDDQKLAQIHLYASATSADIEYYADIHTFNTGITITDLAGIGTRAIAVDANGKIVLL